MPTISALVRARLDEDGVSARQLAKLATDAGYAINHNTISRLAAGPPRAMPEAETIRALGYVCRTTERAVWLAFGRSLGVAVDSAELADMIPAAFSSAPPQVQDAAWRLIRAISDTMSDQRRDGPVPPVPERTLRNPRTIVGLPSSPQTEQSGRRSTSN